MLAPSRTGTIMAQQVRYLINIPSFISKRHSSRVLVFSEDFIRLTPDRQSRKGGVFNVRKWKDGQNDASFEVCIGLDPICSELYRGYGPAQSSHTCRLSRSSTCTAKARSSLATASPFG